MFRSSQALLLPLLSSAVFLQFPLLAQKDSGRVLPVGRPLHVVAFGDFGNGSVHQKRVAEAIAKRNKQDPFDLGITMGDNFYLCGVRSVDDQKWETRWERLYTPLGIPFYASLGNHDYGHPRIICPEGRSSAEAEIDYTAHSSSWRMPAKYYTFTAGPVRFIAIDTEDWSLAELEWIQKTLEESKNEQGIQWRVVYGHHPIYTSGVHLNERRIGALRRELLPVLVKTGVDFYICGHDHDLEHLEDQGIDFLIDGGGGAPLRSFYRKEPQSVFEKSEHAFLDLTIDEHRFTARFLDTELHSAEDPIMTRTK